MGAVIFGIMDNFLASVFGGLFVLMVGWIFKPRFEMLRSLRSDDEMDRLVQQMEYSPSKQLWWRSQADSWERWSIVAGAGAGVAVFAVPFMLSVFPLGGWFVAGAGAVLLVLSFVATYLSNVIREADHKATDTRFRQEVEATFREKERRGELETADAALKSGATVPDGQETDGEGREILREHRETEKTGG